MDPHSTDFATIVSIAFKPIFSSLHDSLVIIQWFTQMSSSRHSSFCGVTAVDSHLECGLSFMLLLPLLKCTTHCFTELTSSIWSPKHSASINECQWMQFFPHGGFSDTPLLHAHVHVRHCFVRLLLCCYLSHSNKMQQNIGRRIQPLLPYQYPPLMLWANIIK